MPHQEGSTAVSRNSKKPVRFTGKSGSLFFVKKIISREDEKSSKGI